MAGKSHETTKNHDKSDHCQISDLQNYVPIKYSLFIDIKDYPGKCSQIAMYLMRYGPKIIIPKIYTLAVLSDLKDVDFQLVVAVVSKSTRQQRLRE